MKMKEHYLIGIKKTDENVDKDVHMLRMVDIANINYCGYISFEEIDGNI